MITVTVGTSSLTIKQTSNSSFFTVVRNPQTKEIELHHNLTKQGELKPAMEIKKTIRTIMNTNSKASYEQRFKKAGKIFEDVKATSFKTLSNRIAMHMQEAVQA